MIKMTSSLLFSFLFLFSRCDWSSILLDHCSSIFSLSLSLLLHISATINVTMRRRRRWRRRVIFFSSRAPVPLGFDGDLSPRVTFTSFLCILGYLLIVLEIVFHLRSWQGSYWSQFTTLWVIGLTRGRDSKSMWIQIYHIFLALSSSFFSLSLLSSFICYFLSFFLPFFLFFSTTVATTPCKMMKWSLCISVYRVCGWS